MAKRRYLSPETTKAMRDAMIANPTSNSLDIIALCAAQGHEVDTQQVARHRAALKALGHKLPPLPKGGSRPRRSERVRKVAPPAAGVALAKPPQAEALEPLGRLTQAEGQLLELAADIGLGRAALILEHAHHAFVRTIQQLQKGQTT